MSIYSRFQETRVKTDYEKLKYCCVAALKCNNAPTDMLACRLERFAFNTVRYTHVLIFRNLSDAQTSFTRLMDILLREDILAIV